MSVNTVKPALLEDIRRVAALLNVPVLTLKRADYRKHKSVPANIGSWTLARKEAAGVTVPADTPKVVSAEAKSLRLDVVKAERLLRARDAQIREKSAQIKALGEQLDAAENAIDEALAVRQDVEVRKIVIDDRLVSDHEAVAIIMLGDWHVAEIVDPSAVDGLNACNPEIMEKRVTELARRTIKILKHQRMSYRIDEALVHLGGDFVSGFLHPELAETNAMPPVEEARFAKRLLREYLEVLRDHGKLKRVHIMCNRGNHGRLTPKIQHKNDWGLNHEHAIFWDLFDHFQSSGWQWSIPRGDFVFATIQTPHPKGPFEIRGYHGHQVRFKDGVGGLSIPLNKLQFKWDAGQGKKDFNLMGHWHTFSQPNERTALNGSLKGIDEYAYGLGCSTEEPMQTLLLFDRKRRMIVSRLPIFCQ